MIFYLQRSRPATTCSALFRILAALALTVKLANSLAPEEEPARHAVPGGRDARTRGSASEEFRGAEDVAAPSSWFGGEGEGLAKNVGLHLKSRDFDLTYLVPKTAVDDDEGVSGAREPISDDELIARAMRDKLFLAPEEWDAEDNYRRIDDGGDNTYVNRIGPNDIPVPQVKPTCRNSVICDDVESYPEEAMERIAQNLGSLAALASHVSNKLPMNRMGDGGMSGKEKPLCGSTMQIRKPKSVRKSTRSAWVHAINTKEFVQEFYITVCQAKDGPCQVSGEALHSPSMYGAGSACRQQHVDQRVLVVENGTARPYVDLFPIPSGCCCHRTGLTMLKSRFGGHLDHRRRHPHDTRGRPYRHPRDD